jgi:thioredoxin 1
MSEPMHVTDAEFETRVLQSPTPVIVDFWAPWCGPCRQVAPSLEKIAKDYDGQVVVAKVNTDDNPQWAQQFEVSGIPTILFVAQGKVVYRQVGAVPFGYLKNIVDKFLEITAAPAEGKPDGATESVAAGTPAVGAAQGAPVTTPETAPQVAAPTSEATQSGN